jgi:hypothetical protein
MTEEPVLTPQAERIVAELEDAVLAHFPDSTFEVRVSPDGRIYFTVYSYVDDDFAIQDLVAERTVNAMLSCDAQIHVMPRRAEHIQP